MSEFHSSQPVLNEKFIRKIKIPNYTIAIGCYRLRNCEEDILPPHIQGTETQTRPNTDEVGSRVSSITVHWRLSSNMLRSPEDWTSDPVNENPWTRRNILRTEEVPMGRHSFGFGVPPGVPPQDQLSRVIRVENLCGRVRGLYVHFFEDPLRSGSVKSEATAPGYIVPCLCSVWRHETDLKTRCLRYLYYFTTNKIWCFKLYNTMCCCLLTCATRTYFSPKQSSRPLITDDCTRYVSDGVKTTDEDLTIDTCTPKKL